MLTASFFEEDEDDDDEQRLMDDEEKSDDEDYYDVLQKNKDRIFLLQFLRQTWVEQKEIRR